MFQLHPWDLLLTKSPFEAYRVYCGADFFQLLLVLLSAKHVVEEPDTGPVVTADPAARQGHAPFPKEEQRGETVSNGIEENACIGPGALLNGRFQLIECVGAGGMSAVYKAVDRRKLVFDEAEPYVAIKVLNRRFQADPQRLAALQRELGSCQQLVHPNIVRVYELHRDGSTAYMTMEYLHGEPLTARIRSERFTGMSAREALPIINAVGQALAYAHSRGIVHCDFKPANVFLSEAGKIKLIDFGISRAFAPHQGLGPRGEERLALIEAISPAYASPEMLEGQAPDPRDDVYGLACTAYELLTGAHPFGYRSAIEARKAGLTVEGREGLSYRQWQALCGALAYNRGERTASVKAFLKEFNGMLWHVKPLHLAAGAAACLLVAIGGMIGLLSNRVGLIGPSEGSAGAGAITESASQPSPATGPLAEIVSIEAVPLFAIAVDHADVIPPLTRLLKPTVPSGTIKPKGKATVSRAPGPRVAVLLAQAERQMATKRLTTPVGDAASESYEQVLKLIPGHEGALEGIARIKGEYKLWAEAEKRRGNWKSAEANLEKALAMDSEDPALWAALRELRETQKRAEKRGVREVREQEPRPLAQQGTLQPKAKRRQMRVAAPTYDRDLQPSNGLAKIDPTKRHRLSEGHASAEQALQGLPSHKDSNSSGNDGRAVDAVNSRFEEFERRMGIR